MKKDFGLSRFSGKWDFSGFSDNPRDFWRIPGIRDFLVSGFLSPGLGIFFTLGIFIPEIRDFS